ncbi:MAG: DUF192 domain-containing protein [Patescibacteria group bacterium]|nr:DUF192 domain-containing protein [Patescibacteria group bacterium]
MRYVIAILIGIALLLALVYVLVPRMAPLTMTTTEITIASTTIQVDIASTTAERVQGLSGYQSLAAGQGMLFIFQQSGSWGFWMKDMNFPLDIIWLGDKGEVITVDSGLAPATYPEVFYPSAPSRFVLEVPAGFAASHGIVPGTSMVLTSQINTAADL